MIGNGRIIRKAKPVTAILLVLFIICAVFTPVFAASDANDARTVRVGWYESPFNITDEFGRRSGYAYEYQQKIAAFTGWKYEYVTGSWSDLMQMLLEGKIDLMSDVSYTEERAERALFPSTPMGSEDYCIFAATGNEEITPENFNALSGKRVGINKDSVQIGFFEDWEKANKIDADIVELNCEVSESLSRLQRGELDALVMLDGYFNLNEATPIAKVGTSNFYFAVNKSHPEMLEELNYALKEIITKDPYYNQKLNSKYIKVSGTNYYIDANEKKWLKEHNNTIRVGYQDNYLAFCAQDPKTKKLTGALKDYLHIAEDAFKNAHIKIEAISFSTASGAMDALKSGKVDCMFPANLTDYDGEEQGFLMTNPLMRTDISAIVLESVKDSFLKKEHVTVAVNEGNPNYNMFLLDNFPKWRPIVFKDTPEGLKAISEGRVDCLLMSNFRYNNISRYCEKYGLTSVSTGIELDYSFAVRRDSLILYSMLNKINSIIPSSTTEAALTHYYTEDAKFTFGDVIKQNIVVIIIVFGVIVIGLLILLLYNIRERKKADTRQKLISATETDSLTGLYSKNFFYEYSARMYLEDTGKEMDIIVLNVEQFHSVNAVHGWEFGDSLLCVIGEAINDFVNEQGGIAGRAEADRFAIYCPHIDSYTDVFDRLQSRVKEFAPNSNIWLRMGVMPYEVGLTPRQQIEHALVACNLARGKYNEHVIVFDGRVREQESYEQRLKNDVNIAVLNGDFEVYYQPKFDIRGKTPVFAGAEALVRWNHPELGLIPPDDFIPIFERNGQIVIVDQYVWEKVAEQISEWRDKYGVEVTVSINLSRVDVYDPKLEERLDDLFEKYELDHAAIRLEITESAYTENIDEMINIIKKLRAKGYAIEMDDFGTGYSSLNLLSLMPISTLKVDRMFIKNIESETKNLQLVKLILDMAKTLKIPAIAEGVETSDQLKQLKKLGCEMVQGYFFSRPIPVAEFEEKYIKRDS